MGKIIKVALTLFSIGIVGIGGVTLINIGITIITGTDDGSQSKSDHEATDNTNYNEGLESMRKKIMKIQLILLLI